jgi:hypothetical protein
LTGGAGTVFLLYVFLPIWLMFLFGLPIAGFSVALAFYKINNQPLVRVVENALKFLSSSRLYLWKKSPQPRINKETEKTKAAADAQLYIPKITKNKLKDLAWSLDVQQKTKSNE